MNAFEIIHSIEEKYGEWLEAAGDNSPRLVNNILVNLLIQERVKNDFLEKKLKLIEKQ